MAEKRDLMTFDEIRRNKDKYLQEYDLISDFNESGCDWNELMSIAEDFHNRRDDYEKWIQVYLSEISNFEHIHSYRHRIKGIDSLIKKIIIKTLEGQKITLENYRDAITDLIGIRVLYVFKSDVDSIHDQIWQKYKGQKVEDIRIKLRQGDDKKIFENIEKKDQAKVEENSVYRSIHYTIYVNKEKCSDGRLEIQTRTIFEEGWSEINHKLVYKNKEVKDYFVLNEASKILSALVGDCDNLGELMKNIHDEYNQKKVHVVDRTEKDAEPDVMEEVLKNFLSKY